MISQGLILGTVLFNLFLNGLALVMRIVVIKFVCDTKSFRIVKNKVDCEEL